MSAMANTTPIVTTVTKPTTKEKTPKEADATPRVNIQYFCEEHYEDILPVIMDKICRDKRKEVHARLDFEESPKKRRIREGSQNSSARTLSARARLIDLVILTRQAQLNPDRTDQTPGIVPIVESALTGGTLLTEIVLEAETAPVASTSHMIIPAPPMGQGPNMDIARAIKTARYKKKVRESESPSSRVSKSGTSDGGHWKSRSKDTSLRMRMTWRCLGYVKRVPRGSRAARVWFNELPSESIDGYKDLKAAFLAYFMQQKKYVKDLVEIHNIKKKDEETIEEFMKRFKVEIGRMKGAPECMRISGFMHGVNNPELTKRLNEHVPKTMEEMMITTTAFIRGEAAAAGKKKGHTSWRTQDQSKRHGSEQRSDFQGQPRDGRGSSKFTPLQEHPKKSSRPKQKSLNPPPPMVTPVKKRSSNKFYDFHNDKGHSTDECMQLKKQIEELVRAGKLSHLIKEIKQGRDQPKVGKKEVPAKDKSMAIYMIQPWHRITRQKVTQSFEHVSKITFPSLTTSSGTEGLLVIEAEIGVHMIHRMLLVTIGDANHSTRAWMNFMIVRSLSSYNGIIGRPGIREIQAVPSTTYGMLNFLVDGGIVTIRSTILILAECATVITSSKEIPKEARVRHENFKVALHPNFLDQEVAIGGTLSAKERMELCSLLKKNLDIFAWQPSDMTGVPRSIVEHRLNIWEGYSPVRQKKRG
ncbi:reverse transcriptase domain-containing protein [Tanacetum coccineum]